MRLKRSQEIENILFLRRAECGEGLNDLIRFGAAGHALPERLEEISTHLELLIALADYTGGSGTRMRLDGLQQVRGSAIMQEK